MAREQTAQKALKKWRDILSLQPWELKLNLSEAKALRVDDQGDQLGECEPDFSTLTATVRVAGDNDGKTVAETVRHECLHCLLAELVWAGLVSAHRLAPETEEVIRLSVVDASERLVRLLERAFDAVGAHA